MSRVSKVRRSKNRIGEVRCRKGLRIGILLGVIFRSVFVCVGSSSRRFRNIDSKRLREGSCPLTVLREDQRSGGEPCSGGRIP